MWDGATLENIYEAEDYRVIFSVTGHWNGGYNANVRLENTRNATIENWMLGFSFQGDLTNIWNGVISEHDDSEYVIKNAGWNQDLEAGKYIEFGISGSGDFTGFPKNYQLLGELGSVSTDDYAIKYRLNSDWGSGFTGEISITNNTSAPIEDWILEFDFDRTITSVWNGVIESHEGSHYSIKNAGYNATHMRTTIFFLSQAWLSNNDLAVCSPLMTLVPPLAYNESIDFSKIFLSFVNFVQHIRQHSEYLITRKSAENCVPDRRRILLQRGCLKTRFYFCRYRGQYVKQAEHH